MITVFNKILYLLTSQERKQSLLLLVLIIIMALMDVVGIASILPFMAVLTNPTLIETNLILNNIFNLSQVLGVQSHEDFLFFLGSLVFLLLILSLFLKANVTYFKTLFVQMVEYKLSERVLASYLNQPYEWFLDNNSAELSKTLLSETQQITGSGIAPILDFFANLVAVFTILILIILVDPTLALFVGLSAFAAYFLAYIFFLKKLNEFGKKRLLSNQLRFSVVDEALGGIKEVKLKNLEDFFIKSFSGPAKNYAASLSSSIAIGSLPRFFFEAVAFGGVLLIILYLIHQKGTFNDALPILSLYVFAGYRLMPALQQTYSSFTLITFVHPSLNKLYNQCKSLEHFYKKGNEMSIDIKKTLSLKKAIVLNNIEYSYPNSSRKILKNINLTIPINSTVGFVGATGSGKTTIVDIILGLLEPQKGTLEVDGNVITKQNVKLWQYNIGYVAQHIYLADDTIAANIAFGEKPENIDYLAVEKASKIANLHTFIKNELPNQYKTKVGERGIRLSGGQRQRIGIARALYNNPKVLILDEATSALDYKTEHEVMNAIKNISKETTIILVAHRLKTVEICDTIFNFDKGRLVQQVNKKF